jgi:hypothetical protein
MHTWPRQNRSVFAAASCQIDKISSPRLRDGCFSFPRSKIYVECDDQLEEERSKAIAHSEVDVYVSGLSA